MSITKKEIKEQLIIHFETLKGNNQFSEFLEFLNLKNLSLEVRFEVCYHLVESDILSDDSDSLIFLYNNSIYLDKESLKKDSQKNRTVYNSKEVGDILYEVHNKLDFLYNFGTLKHLENFLQDANDYLEISWARNDSIPKSEVDEMIGGGPFNWENVVYAGLDFFIDDSLVLYLPGNRYFHSYKSENKRFTKEYFISLTRATTDLVNMQELQGYHQLSPKTQKFIDAGNMFLDIYFKVNISELLDFSPLLLDFTKALESEIKEFFDCNSSYIIPLAELIYTNKEYLNKKVAKKGRFDYLKFYHQAF